MSEAGLSIIEKLWARLDDHLVSHKGSQTEEEEASFKARAKEIAYAIWLLSNPYYAEESDVLRQAQRRYRARQEGRELATPGCKRYNPQPAYLHPHPPVNQTATVSGRGKRAAVGSAIAPEVIRQIENGARSGAFTAHDLADMYHLPVTVIERIVSTQLDTASPSTIG